MTTETDQERICALCHQSGGWTFRDYGDGLAHSDCIDRVGVDYRPTLEELQRAEREIRTLGYVFRDSCGRMEGESYHQDNMRRYHIWGYDLHFASWCVFQQWLADAWSYFDYLTSCDDEWQDGWSD